MKKVIITTLILFLVSAVFMTIQAVMASAEASLLGKQELALIEQKNKLEDSYLEMVSVSDLGAKATDMGFIKPLDLVYFGGSTNVASKN